MKTKLGLTILLLGLTATLGASPVTFSDPFLGSSCGDPSCDVIGNNSQFDIQKIVVNVGTTSGSNTIVDVFFNFGSNNTGLDQFQISPTGALLDPGDLFFTVGGTIKYGIPLKNHAGSPNGGGWATANTVYAGHLYQVVSQSGLMDAEEALNGGSSTYRRDELVWLYNQNGYLSELTSSGTANVLGGGNGVGAPKFDVTLTFPTTAGFRSDMASGNWGIEFGSADCGNDVIKGSSVPEPLSLVLLGSGLLGIGLLRRRRA